MSSSSSTALVLPGGHGNNNNLTAATDLLLPDSLSHGPAATLSAAATMALSDRSYDKRKSGALEVEAVVKALVAEQRRSGVPAMEGALRGC